MQISSIELKNISKIYSHSNIENTNIIDNFNFTIQRNEVVAIIGRSGAGKSTLLQIIGLLISPSFGDIICNINEINNAINIKSLFSKEWLIIQQKNKQKLYDQKIKNLIIPQYVHNNTNKHVLNDDNLNLDTLINTEKNSLNHDINSYNINSLNIINTTEKIKTLIRRYYIGFVYQFHHLLPDFNVIENLIIPQRLIGIEWKMAYDNAYSLLSYLKLENKTKSRISELSGGEQQRIAVIRSMVNNPDLILADEPTGNLDVKNSEYVMQLFLEMIRSQQKSCIIVTHDFKIANQADRIIDISN